MEKLITVIIPCYNVEEYIERAIDSVMQQDFDISAVEIIAINDGSQDGTLNILKSLEQQYPNNLVVISRENKGMAKSRDEGVERANTPYFAFLDADDYLEKDFLEVTYNEIKKGDYDIVVTGSRRIDSKGVISREFFTTDNFEYTKYVLMTAWGKLYRTDFIKSNELRALDNLFGEDVYFLLDAFNKGARVKNLGYIGYNWFVNPESVTGTRYKIVDEEMINSIILFVEKMLELRKFSKEKNLLDYFILKQCVNRILSRGRYATPDQFMKLYKRLFLLLKDQAPEILHNPLIVKGPKGEVKKVRNVISTFVLLHKLKLIGLFSKIYSRGKSGDINN